MAAKATCTFNIPCIWIGTQMLVDSIENVHSSVYSFVLLSTVPYFIMHTNHAKS